LKPYLKWFAIAALIITPPVYFSFAMKLNNPFNFPKDTNSTTILNDYIFSNNRGLALFCVVVISVIMAFYDNFKFSIKKRFNFYEQTLAEKFKCHPSLKKYSSW
jgi:hypothetical protein